MMRLMIIQLRGIVVAKDPEYIILDVQGVGYKVFVTPETLAHTPENKESTLWTYLSVRETSLDIYGFLDRETLIFFELLIGISGVGPKSALSILGLTDVATLSSAIAAGDTSYLTKVSGIGAKSAQKIILELSDKVSKVAGNPALREDADTIDALTSMGYTIMEAREALKQVPKDVTGASDRLKQALKSLAS
ncbi:Holliday junction branch migration protein RuvA [Candidatus Kaiserbacteria bacterium]|nr:MAG: Holliday junction branch migration protein RuvA [Candidatus Kaiserbacteria bacterium]